MVGKPLKVKPLQCCPVVAVQSSPVNNHLFSSATSEKPPPPYYLYEPWINDLVFTYAREHASS